MKSQQVWGLVVGIACAACVWLAPLSVDASAYSHVFVSSFDGSATPAGSLGNPNGIAVDQSTGDVYVADISSQVVDKFTSAGVYLCQITGRGTPSASECDGSTGSKTPEGGFSFPDANGNPAAIAVDNSIASPSAGDVYVMDEGHEAIDKFSAAGAYLGQITGPSPEKFSEVYGLSTNAEGDVWVFEENFSADEFANAEGNEFIKKWDNGEFGSERGFAVDANDQAYAMRGCSCAEKISATGADLGQVDDFGSGRALTVDQARDRLYIDDGSFVSEWNTSGMNGPSGSGTGVEVGEFGSSQLTDDGQGGIAVNSSTDTVYVSDPASSSVYIFGPPPPSAPTVESQSISHVEYSSALLASQILANGAETSYRLEYGPTNLYGQSIPGASLATGYEPSSVTSALSELSPGVEYHFRFVASNARGTAYGKDATFVTYSSPSSGECANEDLRSGYSAELPDCRVFEVVSQANTDDASNIVGMYGYPDGEHVYYESLTPIPGTAQSGNPEVFLASRTASGWQSTPLSPPQGTGRTTQLTNLGTSVTFTEDFSAAFMDSPFDTDPLDQDHGWDVYRVAIPSGSASLASLSDTGSMTESDIKQPVQYEGLFQGPGAWLAGSSTDGSQVFFVSTGKIPTAPGTPPDTHIASNEIYDRADGHTYLVGILPDGSIPACGAEVGQTVESSVSGERNIVDGAIAPDGSNVVFRTPGPGASQVPACSAQTYPNVGALYLRDVVHGRTVALPGLIFGGRTEDGSKILTLGEVGGSSSTHQIYEYDIATGQAVTVGAGQLLAYSADGSRVYYQSSDPAMPGLYVYDSGSGKKTPIPGTQAGGYAGGAISNNEQTKTSSVIADMPVSTVDGSDLLFIDRAQLTKYDNEGHQEAYVYHADTGSVTCVSCNPSGAVPQGDADLVDSQHVDNHAFHTASPPFISRDGSRVVFETTDSLVPQDTNGLEDVYEWEGGRIFMLSSGTGSVGSYLVGASEEVNDVYMQTNDALLPGIDNAVHIYDARAGGGFPYLPPAFGCVPSQCQGPESQPPSFAAPASIAFAGAGNLVAPAPKKKAAKSASEKHKKHKKVGKHKKVKQRKHAKKHKKRKHPSKKVARKKGRGGKSALHARRRQGK